MKKIIYIITQPLFILTLALGLFIYTQTQIRVRHIDFENPKNIHIESTYKGNTTFDKYCIYTYKDGTVTKKYLLTVDTTSPDIDKLDQSAYSQCH